MQTREIGSWFGGMGTASDFYLCSMNGHKVSDEDYQSLNEAYGTARLQVVRALKALDTSFERKSTNG